MVPTTKGRAAALTGFAFAVAFLLSLTTTVRAHTEQDSSFSFVIPEVQSLNLETGISYLNVDAGEFLVGWTNQEELSVVVSANSDWVLTIRGTESMWEGPWQKPVGDIWWEYNGGGFTPLDTVPVEACAGGPSDNESYTIRFRIALDIERDIPGDYYYSDIVFELTTP